MHFLCLTTVACPEQILADKSVGFVKRNFVQAVVPKSSCLRWGSVVCVTRAAVPLACLVLSARTLCFCREAAAEWAEKCPVWHSRRRRLSSPTFFYSGALTPQLAKMTLKQGSCSSAVRVEP